MVELEEGKSSSRQTPVQTYRSVSDCQRWNRADRTDIDRNGRYWLSEPRQHWLHWATEPFRPSGRPHFLNQLLNAWLCPRDSEHTVHNSDQGHSRCATLSSHVYIYVCRPTIKDEKYLVYIFYTWFWLANIGIQFHKFLNNDVSTRYKWPLIRETY